MTTLMAALLGGVVGAGVWLVVAGWQGRRVLPRLGSGEAFEGLSQVVGVRAGVAVLVGLGVWLMSGWPVAGLAAAGGVVFAPRVVGAAGDRRVQIDRTEAIATWTEMLRDVIVAGAGLQEAIVATAPVAPEPIRPELLAAMRRLGHVPLGTALGRLQEELDHPSADLVVVSLVQATSDRQVSDLGACLSRLAETARAEARMRVSVEVGRASLRTGRRIVVGTVVALVVVLTLLDVGLLADAYDSPSGQAVLAVAMAGFGLGMWLLDRMARIRSPERFATSPDREGS